MIFFFLHITINILVPQYSRGQYHLRFLYHNHRSWLKCFTDSSFELLRNPSLSINVFLLPQTHKAISRENDGEVVSV